MRPLTHPSIDDVTVEGILHALSDPVRARIYATLACAERANTCSAFLQVDDRSVPKSTLSQHFRALREIQRRVGLDFFGIDCGLDQAGHLVVFEVNASMLVHNRNEKFPYKDASVARIKQAFGDMLRKTAGLDDAPIVPSLRD